ncbi:MAG: peptidylprolyl isomerase [Hyphomicrobiaceae bacterium]|nr:peptidylprolyl isomerase [Hyphomicrobiaceae bacterium]
MLKTVALALSILAALVLPAAAQATDVNPEDVLVMELPAGRVLIRLRPDLAPMHAQRLRLLAREGFYDNVPFHRVIEGFMAQTGDPTGTGMGGSSYPDLAAEFSPRPYERGVVGMARAADPNSANSQFFIMFGTNPSLNGQYTVVGEVIEGMDLIDAIKRGDPRRNGMVAEPDRITRIRVLADQR